MKLLYITNGINGSGGLERVLSVKASYFAANMGYEVHILVLNHADRNPFYTFDSRIRFHSIAAGGHSLAYWKSYRQGIQRVVNAVQPEIISVCDDGLKAFFIPQFLKTNAKIIYERHVSKLIEATTDQSWMKNQMVKAKWWLMEKLATRFSKFVVLTEGNKKEWASLRNMVVIANPLSFYPATSSSLERKIVICVGKISYQKGQDLLLKAWESVHQQCPDWQLHLYGKENLQILDTTTLKHNVFYFPPEKDIEQKYLESSVYVMSSRFEGFGMVLIEAMACGVPCVSFDCDYGPGDIINNGVDGFVAEKENVTQLSHQLIRLMTDEKKRQQMGKAAKASVKRYEMEVIAWEWDRLFKSVIASETALPLHCVRMRRRSSSSSQ